MLALLCLKMQIKPDWENVRVITLVVLLHSLVRRASSKDDMADPFLLLMLLFSLPFSFFAISFLTFFYLFFARVPPPPLSLFLSRTVGQTDTHTHSDHFVRFPIFSSVFPRSFALRSRWWLGKSISLNFDYPCGTYLLCSKNVTVNVCLTP